MTIQWHWQHRVHKTKTNKAKTQHNICVGHHYNQTNTNNVINFVAYLMLISSIRVDPRPRNRGPTSFLALKIRTPGANTGKLGSIGQVPVHNTIVNKIHLKCLSLGYLIYEFDYWFLRIIFLDDVATTFLSLCWNPWNEELFPFE
jgi:hypothetical protein